MRQSNMNLDEMMFHVMKSEMYSVYFLNAASLHLSDIYI